MSKFRHKPSHRRAPKPQASWLVVGWDTSREILHHGRTTYIVPVRSNDHHKRYTPNQRLALKAYVGGVTECHINLVSVDRIQLRDVDYPTVRELGHIRVDDFHLDWVETHDQAWLESTEAELIVDAMLERFGRRHGHREVWVIRFAVERMLPDRFLAQNSEEGYTESAARGLKNEPPALHDHEWKDHVGLNLERTHEDWLALARDRKRRPPKHLRKAA